jgi:cyanobactin maturation PatA/PatG family protease
LDSIKIGIVDGLPDLAHPSLKGASIDILQLMVPDGSWTPNPHGTSICSVILGNGDAVRGLAPGCSGLLLPIFFGQQTESRIRPLSQLDLARAVTFALEKDVSIINISAGQKVAALAADDHLDQALRRCAERRVLVVAAVGNDGCACVHVPAGITSVLAVGAADKQGQPLDFSNWGEPYRKNGLLAPGDGLTVAAPGGGVHSGSGTSIATAVVSGVAALLLSVAHREGYPLNAIDVREILLESAAPCRLEGEGACDRYLAGQLDAASALALLHQAGAARSSGPAKCNARSASSNAAADYRRFTSSVREHSTVTSATLDPITGVTQDETGSMGVGRLPQARPNDESRNAESAKVALQSLAPSNAQNGSSGGVSLQECLCGQSPHIVFALGSLWFDWGTEARQDLFIQQPSIGVSGVSNHPELLFDFLKLNPHFLVGLTFILMHEAVPIYAIQPIGPYAQEAYKKMLDILELAMGRNGIDQRVSIAGLIGGSTRLMNGMTVPIVHPDLRGMWTWQPEELLKAVRSDASDGGAAAEEQLSNFLNRVYYELRNFGVAPQDRALNYAATNLYQANEVFRKMVEERKVLDGINVVKSPIGRPDSDCWDIELSVFDPHNDRAANSIYRFTVDVSEVIPVTVGRMRMWQKRPA